MFCLQSQRTSYTRHKLDARWRYYVARIGRIDAFVLSHTLSLWLAHWRLTEFYARLRRIVYSVVYPTWPFVRTVTHGEENDAENWRAVYRKDRHWVADRCRHFCCPVVAATGRQKLLPNYFVPCAPKTRTQNRLHLRLRFMDSVSLA